MIDKFRPPGVIRSKDTSKYASVLNDKAAATRKPYDKQRDSAVPVLIDYAAQEELDKTERNIWQTVPSK